MSAICRRYCAVAAIGTSNVRIVPTSIRAPTRPAQFIASRITDAMRPGVIPADSDAAGSASLYGYKHPVIAGRTTAVYSDNVAVVLAGVGILQNKPPALFGVGRR